MKTLLAAVLFTSAWALPCSAAAVNYNIDFSGSTFAGTPLPTGSFAYDPSVGFVNFLVNWDGVTFDLTNQANAPALGIDPSTGCDFAARNHQYGFLFMSQTANCPAPAQYAWSGFYFDTIAQFTLQLDVPAGDFPAEDAISVLRSGDIPSGLDFGSGSWTVSQVSAVPEPSTLAMGVGAILVGLAFVRRR